MTTDDSESMLRFVRACLGAESATVAERVQSLWSGYGEIVRVQLEGAAVPSVIVKRVEPPTEADHPRGWNTDLSVTSESSAATTVETDVLPRRTPRRCETRLRASPTAIATHAESDAAGGCSCSRTSTRPGST